MKMIQGLKEHYKNLSWYNQGQLIRANRPFGKDAKELKEMLMWFLAVLSIIGVVMNVQYNRSGFLLWMLTNACWAVIDFRRRLYAQSFLFAVYFILSFWGWISWQR